MSVFPSTSDTTATYKAGSWNFATNGSTLILSTLIYASGGNNGDKIQLGVINSTTNGLNANAGVAFESFRFLPSSATVWAAYEQYRSADSTVDHRQQSSEMSTVVAGHWYKFVVAMTKPTSGASGNLTASCALFRLWHQRCDPRSQPRYVFHRREPCAATQDIANQSPPDDHLAGVAHQRQRRRQRLGQFSAFSFKQPACPYFEAHQFQRGSALRCSSRSMPWPMVQVPFSISGILTTFWCRV